MNKTCLTICFYLSFLLFFSCERPDLTSEVESAYDYVKKDCYTNFDCPPGKWCSDGLCILRENVNECTTIDGNMWSSKSSSEMDWDDAVSYCDNLTECGYSDWHLPTISELRTLIKNCSATETDGSCDVTDGCLSSICRNNACSGCDYDESGGHSKLEDTGWFWSSSTRSDDTNLAWRVDFYGGGVYDYSKNGSYSVRCVRNAE